MEDNILIIWGVRGSVRPNKSVKKCIMLNLDHPYLDYPDFLIIQTFSLVSILSWIFISHDQDPLPYSF